MTTEENSLVINGPDFNIDNVVISLIVGPVRSETSANKQPKRIEEFSCSSQYIFLKILKKNDFVS